MWLSYFKKMNSRTSLVVGASDIHANEYRLIQDDREKLPVSSYKQLQAKVRFRMKRTATLQLKLLSGERDIDKLKRSEISAGVEFSRLIKRRYSGSLLAGVRKKFTNNDKFYRIGIGHYGRKLETNVEYESSTETKFDGSVVHPSVVELSFGFMLGRKIFGTAIVRQSKDENVNIMSGLFRVSTRFGNKEVAPIRDGAPPRGRM
jgi:hypothetical protein